MVCSNKFYREVDIKVWKAKRVEKEFFFTEKQEFDSKSRRTFLFISLTDVSRTRQFFNLPQVTSNLSVGAARVLEMANEGWEERLLCQVQVLP
jgi:hypothetical protein